MKSMIAVTVFMCLVASAYAATDDGMPYGKISDSDINALTAFAETKGVNLGSELRKTYEKKDLEALGRVFQFSTQFSSLDAHARSYGQIIYSSLLNLGESWGVEAYAKVVSAQTTEVQQRIRDFIYYPLTLLPEQERQAQESETRQAYPLLFPGEYEFGRGNPVFRKGA